VVFRVESTHAPFLSYLFGHHGYFRYVFFFF
jgi:hypothetical protein